MSYHIGLTNIPNDLYTTLPWSDGVIDGPPTKVSYETLGDLNAQAMRAEGDILKVSFNTLDKILDEYIILPVGNCLVTTGGPVIVAKEAVQDFSKVRLGTPGLSTTAHMLATGFLGEFKEIETVPFQNIISAVQQGECDCGLLIHTTPEIIKKSGLVVVADLTQMWIDKYKLPLPLGGLVAKRELGEEALTQICQTLRKSMDYSEKNFDWFSNRCITESPFESSQQVKNCTDQWISPETYNISSDGIAAIMELEKYMDGPCCDYAPVFHDKTAGYLNVPKNMKSSSEASAEG